MAEHRSPRPRPRPQPVDVAPEATRRWARIAGALVLAALGIGMFWEQAWIRVDEARLAGDWFGAALGGSVQTSRDVVFFSWLHGPVVGMRITAECTVALLTGPLCLLGAALLVFARTRWNRLLGGLAVGLVTVIVVNQVRLMIIAVAMQHWGMTGYHVSHKFIGTVVALAGFVAGALAMLRIATSGEPERSA